MNDLTKEKENNRNNMHGKIVGRSKNKLNKKILVMVLCFFKLKII